MGGVVRRRTMRPGSRARAIASRYDIWLDSLSGHTNMKRLLIVLLVVAVGVGVLGFTRGWFSATTAEAGSGKSGLVFSWDKAKFKADMGAAGSKIKALSVAAVDKIKGKAKSVSATETHFEGKVTAVDAAAHTVKVDVGGEVLELSVPAHAGIEQLLGKTVEVKLEKDGDHMLVREIAEKK
jgi:hypothetical protein